MVRFGAFGDTVLLIPMLKALAARYGRRCDVVSSGPWVEPLLSRVPSVDEQIVLTSRRAPYLLNRSQHRLVRWLRTRPPGPVYVAESDEKTHWLLARGGVTQEWICTLRDCPRLPGEHIVTHMLRLAAATPPALRHRPPPDVDWQWARDLRPSLSEADRRDCRDWIAVHRLGNAPLVLLQPGNKRTMRRGSRRRASNIKYWPEAHWAHVIAAIHTLLPAARVVLCGAPGERALAEDIARRVPDSDIVIATDDLPIPRLLALLERAHSMISVDTGPAHAAAAMGCPLVVLHPLLDTTLYAPVPSIGLVRMLTPDPSDIRMASIRPERVVEAWRRLIASTDRTRAAFLRHAQEPA